MPNEDFDFHEFFTNLTFPEVVYLILVAIWIAAFIVALLD